MELKKLTKNTDNTEGKVYRGDSNTDRSAIVAIIVKNTNKHTVFLDLLDSSIARDDITIEFVQEEEVRDAFKRNAQKAIALKTKTLLITNIALRLDTVKEMKSYSGSYLRLVSFNRTDLSDLSAFVRGEYDIVEKLNYLTKSTDEWFSIADKYIYFERNNYFFERYNPYLDHLNGISRTVPVDLELNADTTVPKNILILQSDDKLMSRYSSVIELVEEEYKYIDEYIAEYERDLSDMLPNSVLNQDSDYVELVGGFSIKTEYDMLTITNVCSPYVLHMDISQTGRDPMIYICDKDYDGDVEYLENINSKRANLMISQKEAVDFLIKEIIMNEELWVEAGYNQILIEEQSKFRVESRSFIDVIVDVFVEQAKFTAYGQEFPKFIRSEGYRSSIAIMKYDKSYIYLTSLIPE